MATNTLNFRLATKEDAVQLERLINTAFSDDKTKQIFLSVDPPTIDVTTASTIKAKIAEPGCAVLVATSSDGAIVSHCSVRKLDETRAWLGLLAVDVGSKGRGLGSQVLAYAEKHAQKEWGSTRMEFDVVCTRAGLIAWYNHRGYQATGETTPFPYDHHPNWEGVLRDDLHFIILGKDIGQVPPAAGHQ